MDTEKTVDVLNRLVEINNDRIEGYETASKEIEEQDFKSLFSQFAQTSYSCKQELTGEIYRLGGEPTEETKITGKFFRVWMDVKAALTGKDIKAVLVSCEYGEDHAIKTYENVLEEELEHLSLAQQSMIRNQYTLIKSDHYRIKSMRDAMVV